MTHFKLFVISLIVAIVGANNLPFFHPYPFIVSLQIARGVTLTKYCAGVVIDSKWILTTATCVDDKIIKNDTIYAFGGVLNSYQFHYKYGQFRKIVKIVNHPNYSGYLPDKIPKNDIALLRVNEPFTPNSNLNFAELPKTENVTGSGDIIGWGASELPADQKQSDRLLYATLNVVDQKECEKAYNAVLEDKFCVGTSNQVACSGDGGGAFVQYDQNNGASIVSGVVSVGAIPCTDKPALYTNVGHHLDFIKEVTKQFL